jgi:pimeloyl-ACP methyl ester carboxylesterase
MVKRIRLAAEDTVSFADGSAPPWPGREVLLDGAKTFVRTTPARAEGAEPALYLHGLGGSSANWTDLAGLLADRLAGQAIDLPGFGASEPAESYSLAAMARRVARWIEASGAGSVHLMGNSMGGAVGVHLAATRPELVRTLTLISPAMPFLDPRRSAQGRMVPLLFLPNAPRLAARRMTSLQPDDLARMIVETCFADPTCIPDHRMAEAAEEVRLRSTIPWYAEAYVRSLRSLVGSFVRAYLPGGGSLWRMAGRIKAPTLVIAGMQDRLVDIRVAPRVAMTIPDSRLMLLDGVGHVAQMEAPRAVARAFLGLLDEGRVADVTSECRMVTAE